VPKEVLVEFRDVFGSSNIYPNTAAASAQVAPSRMTRDTSLAESFATFGPRHRQPSAESNHDDDDSWSYTLSAYASDGEEDPLGTEQAGVLR
jgi:hypothetical protein